MSLPIGFERKDEKKFEEITIPATTKSADDVVRCGQSRLDRSFVPWEIFNMYVLGNNKNNFV
jgi:hypothetical protein